MSIEELSFIDLEALGQKSASRAWSHHQAAELVRASSDHFKNAVLGRFKAREQIHGELDVRSGGEGSNFVRMGNGKPFGSRSAARETIDIGSKLEEPVLNQFLHPNIEEVDLLASLAEKVFAAWLKFRNDEELDVPDVFFSSPNRPDDLNPRAEWIELLDDFLG